jgi:hypothetical protein
MRNARYRCSLATVMLGAAIEWPKQRNAPRVLLIDQ